MCQALTAIAMDTNLSNCVFYIYLHMMSFQQLYLCVTRKLCCNDLKFWLVCEGVFKFGHHFKHQLKQKQPETRKFTWRINCLDIGMEMLLTSVQIEISHLLGLSNATFDLKYIYHLIIMYNIINPNQW